jgi:hypothetical protein
MEDLDVHDIASRLAAGHVLQLYSDGGFNGTNGAAAFVVVCSEWEGGSWQARVCGYRGTYMNETVSSFQAELVAAEAAITFSLVLGQAMR